MEEKKTIVRPARSGEGQALFDVTKKSVEGLATGHYSSEQIAGWMGPRTAAYYEDIIDQGSVKVAEQDGRIVGFVQAEPGEITRLFIVPEASGAGLGRHLLGLGIESAKSDHHGPIRVESTLNAEAFYLRHGFKTVGRGISSHSSSYELLGVVYMEL